MAAVMQGIPEIMTARALLSDMTAECTLYTARIFLQGNRLRHGVQDLSDIKEHWNLTGIKMKLKSLCMIPQAAKLINLKQVSLSTAAAMKCWRLIF